MIKLFIALSTVAVASTVAFAQPSVSSDEAEIRRVNQELFRAFNALDAKTLDGVLADKAIFSNGGEKTDTKAELMTTILPLLRREHFTPIAHTNIFRVTVRGDSAVVVGRAWRPSKSNGGEKMVFTHIFTKQNDQWRIAELITTEEN